MYQFKLDKFEGPLDLLLKLIEDEEMDITEVSLANVTGQYLSYLQQTENIPTDELADFLVVAAKLLLIKSKILLPNLELGAEEEANDLEKQLKIYRIFLDASRKIHKMIGKKKFAYLRETTKNRSFIPVFNPPKNVTSEMLKEFFANVLGQIEPVVKLPETMIRKTVSIQEKINEIQEKIISEVKISFNKLLSESKNKTEIIVTFLALLELVKQRSAVVIQQNIFEDIYIQKYEEEIINL